MSIKTYSQLYFLETCLCEEHGHVKHYKINITVFIYKTSVQKGVNNTGNRIQEKMFKH